MGFSFDDIKRMSLRFLCLMRNQYCEELVHNIHNVGIQKLSFFMQFDQTHI